MFRKAKYRIALILSIIGFLAGCGEKVPLPHAPTEYKITYSGKQFIGDTIEFSSNAPAKGTYLWKFGDGVESIEEHPRHVYYSTLSNGAAIIADTVVLIVNNDIYNPN